MADVQTLNLDQRLDLASQYFPHNTPASIATTTPVQPLSASFGGFDLTGEAQTYVNFFDFDWPLIAAMTLQFSDQELPQSNVSPPQQQQQQQQQNPRQQFNEMTFPPNQHHYPQQSSILQPSPPFVEPSGNYIAVPPTTTTTTQNLPYGYPSSTLPDNGNVGNNFSSQNHNAFVGNSNQQQQQSQHHRNNMTNQLIPGYNYCLPQREIYHPSSISNNNSCQQHHKSIPRSNYSQDVATTLPISMAFMPQFNNQTNNGSTMLVPLFDHPTAIFATKPATSIPTTIPISQSSQTSETNSNGTSPIKQTYSYSGPPKSYYSRLPLYDRPYKCDQCPQSFNRNHDLKRHKRIHLAVKPYPCHCCDKQFSRKDALKRHILVKNCNNTSKRSTSPNSNNGSKNAVKSTTNSSTSAIVDNGDPIKTEPTSDGYGMST